MRRAEDAASEPPPDCNVYCPGLDTQAPFEVALHPSHAGLLQHLGCGASVDYAPVCAGCLQSARRCTWHASGHARRACCERDMQRGWRHSFDAGLQGSEMSMSEKLRWSMCCYGQVQMAESARGGGLRCAHAHTPLCAAGMYIGPTEKHTESVWTFDARTGRMVQKERTIVPGLFKVGSAVLAAAQQPRLTMWHADIR